MKTLARLLVILLASGDSALCQQTTPPPAASTPAAQTTSTPATQLPAAQAVAGVLPNTLMDGTAVRLRTTETLSSATNRTGEQVLFEVVEDISVQGVTVIAKGSQAKATVVMAEAKRSMGRAGKLDVHVDSVRLVDGDRAMLSAIRDEKGGNHTTGMAVGMVATSIVFFPAAPFLLFIKGKDITIPKGTEITAYIQGDMKLEMTKFMPVDSAAVAAAAAAAAAPAPTAVLIESTVANSDIEVDGKFVGNSPSTVSLLPGEHTIVVKKTGYTDWTRTMQVSGPTAHLNAELVAK